MSDSSAGHAAIPPSAPRFVFEPISESHATAAFRCGAAFLDRFLVQDALTLAAADVSRTFVLTAPAPGATEGVTGTEAVLQADTAVKKKIAGFFTLEAGVMPTAFLSLLPEDALARLITLEDAAAEGMPPPPRPGVSPLSELPVVYLAYLARDLRYRGQGMGDLLLVEALRKAAQAANLLGAAGLFLVTTQEGAQLYAEYGFRSFGDWPRKMFLSMAAMRRILALVAAPMTP